MPRSVLPDSFSSIPTDSIYDKLLSNQPLFCEFYNDLHFQNNVKDGIEGFVNCVNSYQMQPLKSQCSETFDEFPVRNNNVFQLATIATEDIPKIRVAAHWLTKSESSGKKPSCDAWAPEEIETGGECEQNSEMTSNLDAILRSGRRDKVASGNDHKKKKEEEKIGTHTGDETTSQSASHDEEIAWAHESRSPDCSVHDLAVRVRTDTSSNDAKAETGARTDPVVGEANATATSNNKKTTNGGTDAEATQIEDVTASVSVPRNANEDDEERTVIEEVRTETQHISDCDDAQHVCNCQDSFSEASEDTGKASEATRHFTEHQVLSALEDAGSTLPSPLALRAQEEEFTATDHKTHDCTTGRDGRNPKAFITETFEIEGLSTSDTCTVGSQAYSDASAEPNSARSKPLTHDLENKSVKYLQRQLPRAQTAKKIESCTVLNNQSSQLQNSESEAKVTTVVLKPKHKKTPARVDGEKYKLSLSGSVHANSDQNNTQIKEHASVEARDVIALPLKSRQGVQGMQTDFQTESVRSFRDIQKVTEKLDKIAESLSCKNVDYFDKGFSKTASLRLLRLARNETSSPAGTFDVQTAAPATFYDPIAFFSSPRERLRWEFWRLSTFAPVSESLPVSPIRLAQCGFYYDEDQDDIVCFSCGLSKRTWNESEKAVAVIHLHLSEFCRQANFADERNVPITVDTPRLSPTQMHSETPASESRDGGGTRPESEVTDSSGYSQRSGSTLSRNQSDASEVATGNQVSAPSCQREADISPTASSGNENLGQTQVNSGSRTTLGGDRVPRHRQLRVLSSGTALQQTVLPPSPNLPDVERTTSHAPTVSTTSANANAAVASRYPVQPEQAPFAVPPGTVRYGSGRSEEAGRGLETDDDRSEVSGLDLRRAACREQSSVEQRMASFADWPLAGLPCPRHLVPAGFYYMGVGDSVRCFYCGVTLRNWREDDDPWMTHVRFRFSCDYVTAVKGENFVIRTLNEIANGRTGHSESEEAQGSGVATHSSRALTSETFSESISRPELETTRRVPFDASLHHVSK